jgi:DNA-binding CsgD family transcriptional regulator
LIATCGCATLLARWKPDRTRSAVSQRLGIFGILVVQSLCAFYLLSDIVVSLLGLRPLNWQLLELIQISAGAGLVIGIVLGANLLRQTMARNTVVERQLRAASGAFMDLLEERFTDWGLTPAERDVALFSIKGMSTQDIATLRATSEGTVKAQTNAIYRKAGVSGRPQLLSLFIEELMNGPVNGMPAPVAPPVAAKAETPPVA